MCIWQCSCTLQTWGFARPAVNCPWLSAVFPLCFFLSDPPAHLPSVTGHCLAGCPHIGAAGEKHSSQQHTPSKAKENSSPWVRDAGKGPVQQGYVQPLVWHMWALDLLQILLLCQEPGKALPKAIFSSVCDSQTNNRPTAHDVIKIYVPYILRALPVYYGWWSTV